MDYVKKNDEVIENGKVMDFPIEVLELPDKHPKKSHQLFLFVQQKILITLDSVSVKLSESKI